MRSQRIDPKTINDDGTGWTLIEETPGFRRYMKWVDDTRQIIKTEYLQDETMQAFNQELAWDSRGRRLGDYTHVGSIPLNVFYSPDSQISEKLKEDDKVFMKWFLNSDAGKPYKTWWGKL